ncbi:16S rRNA (cytosine(967)-C(5))-methyltransferase RsmB [Paraglaciecola sp. MB-3u-78]|jgi:16S rRNA (cytosine967-C5)-methyltransferase|uniref:16S rRNA (cytosine(967)-C(5))-methyltransferase RsmB n=1 Tax=Paraglaciecola sp. MB-3u-78 TaxID=2058332 RepID=UPI000C32059F|nr:16S rRNA (cytosine(967)-C(5))-methyltransferase RsmB [Paraglaciecola sp. MB-3u-78]PKG97922.1 16S rRNA (cytosine(967)-C(5))-methyltransferase [Paraglaciecola sp. MB-3u-78]
MKSFNLRADAAKVLHQILEEGQSARECLPLAQLPHKEQDKAWLQEMVYGVLRNLPILQFWLRQLLDKPLKNRYKIVEQLIMLGFYQLSFSRVSQHAAVSETVAACQPLNTLAMKGLVNAILRTFIREEMSEQAAPNKQIASGLPKWLYKKLEAEYQDDFIDLLANMQVKAPIWLRVNTRKISRVHFVEALENANIEFKISPDHSEALILSKGYDVTSLPGFDEGWFAVQDGAAQLAAYYLKPAQGESILDCCAAPGGKTCHLLEYQPKIAKIVALEINEKRASRIEENLIRLGHNADIIIGDASTPEKWWDGQLFDRVLLDAPCSATGIIRRHPDIKWLRKTKDIDVLVNLQKQILDAIWPLVKPGGTMLYATCSVLPEENHLQISDFLSRTPNALLDNTFYNDTDERPGKQIMPGEQQMDGFYYARLLKS